MEIVAELNEETHSPSPLIPPNLPFDHSLVMVSASTLAPTLILLPSLIMSGSPSSSCSSPLNVPLVLPRSVKYTSPPFPSSNLPCVVLTSRSLGKLSPFSVNFLELHSLSVSGFFI